MLGGFSTRHMISALDAAVLNDAAVGVAHATGVGPARSEDAILSSDRIDVHVLGTVVPREPLQELRVSQDDVADTIHDIDASEVDGYPGALSGLSALAPVGRALRGDA